MASPAYSIVFSAQLYGTDPVTAGAVMLPSSSDSSKYVVATSANRGTRRAEGIALTTWAGSILPGSVEIQQTGTIDASISGLGTSAGKSLVRCSSTGAIERIATGSVNPSTDDLIGYAEADGRVHLYFGYPFAELLSISGASVAAGDGVRVTSVGSTYTVHGVRGTCSLEQFGAVGDGTTDDSAAMTAAVAALTAGTYGTLALGAKTYNVGASSPYTLPANVGVIGQGPGVSILKTTANQTLLLVSSEDVFLRDFQVLGNSTGSSQTAIRSGTAATAGSGVSRLTISSLVLKNLGGNGIEYNQNPLMGGATTYAGPLVSNTWADGCGTGFKTGTRGEYIRFTACHAERCTSWGFSIYSGNVGIVNCTSTKNANGIDVGLNDNEAHGDIIGCAFNHNTTINVRYAGRYGQKFVGCCVFQGGSGGITANAWGYGLEFIGCLVDVTGYTLDSGTVTRFVDCQFDNTYGNATTNISTGAQVVIEGARMRLDGSTPTWWLPFLQKNYTFPSDADQTLTAQQSWAETLIVQTGIVTGNRKLTSARAPQAGGVKQRIINNGAFPVQFAWSTGTAVTIPIGVWALVGSDGTNAILTETGFSPPANTGLVAVTSGSPNATAINGTDGYFCKMSGGAPVFAAITAANITSAPGTSGQLISNSAGAFGALAYGTSLQYLRTNSGATAVEWATLTAPGATTNVVYNSSNAYAANSSFTYDGSGTITVSTAVTSPRVAKSGTQIALDTDTTQLFVGTSNAYTNQFTNLRLYASGNAYLGLGSSNAFSITASNVLVQRPGGSVAQEITSTEQHFGVPVGGYQTGNVPYRYMVAAITATAGGASLTIATNAQYVCPIIDFTTNGDNQVLVLPNSAGATFRVRQLGSGVNMLVKCTDGSTGTVGTGVTIAASKTAIVRCTSAEYIRVTSDA